ncbi:hypothetical protein [Pseudomonas leptonychotis]|uniref:ATP-binding protein n=1 Tax=Pseudomonas leptonychotis TaxID=2448482 RepID=A0A4T2A2F7_9PSED|nr:hypothetical protein [Pseudomonas leptonychotis]TIH10807.1 hypothetical protein D8779_09055 [Pseudomonas leptonychotis]
MQLNIDRGAPGTGKSTRLLQIHKVTCKPGQKILRGVHCTTTGLELKVREYAKQGVFVICIDECTELQVMRLQDLTERLPADLVIHAVVGF